MEQDASMESTDRIPCFEKKVMLRNRFSNTTVVLTLKVSDERILGAKFDGELDPLTAIYSHLETCTWEEALQQLSQSPAPYRNHLLLNHILILEKFFKISSEIPRRATYLRTVLLELERIITHLKFLGAIAQAFTFPFLQLRLLDFTSKIKRLGQRLTASPPSEPFLILGGVQDSNNQKMIPKILEQLKELWKKSEVLTYIFKRNLTIRNALQDVGFITRADAKKFSFVGPLARSTGITEDLRKTEPYLAYNDIDFSIPVSDACDLFGEVLVRIDEIQESFKICIQLLARLPDGTVKFEVPREGLMLGTTINRLETPSGELFTFVLNKEKTLQNSPRVYQVTSPLKVNQQGILLRLSGEMLDNLSPLVAAISEGWSE